jgi:hypothetical protein
MKQVIFSAVAVDNKLSALELSLCSTQWISLEKVRILCFLWKFNPDHLADA